MQLGEYLEFKVKKGGTIKYVVDQPNAKGVVFKTLSLDEQAIFERLAYLGKNTDFISFADLRQYRVIPNYVVKSNRARRKVVKPNWLEKIWFFIFSHERVSFTFKKRKISLRKGKITDQGIVYELLSFDDKIIFKYLVELGRPPNTITFTQLSEYFVIPQYVVRRKRKQIGRQQRKSQPKNQPQPRQIPAKYKPIYDKLIAKGVQPNEITIQILQDLYNSALDSSKNIDTNYDNLFG